MDSTLRSRRVRHGFTLVELLVVIAIIGVLVALLLPAVQAAREAARRMQCSNNFRQVGIGMHNYHDAVRTFPSGIHMWSGGTTSCASPSSTAESYYGWSWSAFLLPYIEGGNVYAMFDFNETGFTDPISFKAGGQFIASYSCPSDLQSGEWINATNFFTYHNGPTPQDDMAVTSMAGVADSFNHSCPPLGDVFIRPNGDGVLFQRSKIRIKNIADGTSKTLMVGEAVGAGPGTHLGYFWVTHNILHTRNGINLPLRLKPTALFGNPSQTGFASHHPGGCHFLFVDGSAHFVSEEIAADVMRSLTTRNGISSNGLTDVMVEPGDY